ncbi:MAG: hypothetical protein ORN27_00605 [Rhodoluna sp.]|nr:hypothetical protein [Rhodoluna sp.]
MKKTFITSICLATSLLFVGATGADAHVSVYPGVTATGSSTAALTAGQSGTLFFRAGHGCTDQTGIKSPVTGLSMSGTTWATSEFSVHVPLEATGTGSTIPKPAYIPGWKNKVTKNVANGSFDVTWTAVSPDFYLPDSPEGDGGGKIFMDFGIAIKWKAGITGTDVWFPSKQTCVVDMTNKPAGKSSAVLTLSKAGVLSVAAKKANAGKIVDLKVNGEALRSAVKLDKAGALTLKLTPAETLRAKAQGAVLTVVQGEALIGYLGGQVASRKIYVSWDVTDGSGADTVLDDIEHNTAPKVTVL